MSFSPSYAIIRLRREKCLKMVQMYGRTQYALGNNPTCVDPVCVDPISNDPTCVNPVCVEFTMSTFREKPYKPPVVVCAAITADNHQVRVNTDLSNSSYSSRMPVCHTIANTATPHLWSQCRNTSINRKSARLYTVLHHIPIPSSQHYIVPFILGLRLAVLNSGHVMHFIWITTENLYQKIRSICS